MQISISNFIELEAYVKALVPRVAGLTDYAYIGQGEEFTDLIEAYYNRKYKPGLTLFFGIFDAIDNLIETNQTTAVINTQLLIMTNADRKIPYDTLRAYNDAWLTMTKVIGRIEQDMECSVRNHPGKPLSIDVTDRKLHPLENIVNSNAYGYAIELAFAIRANTFKYS